MGGRKGRKDGRGKEGEKKGKIMCPRCLVIFELNILAIFAESYVFLHFRGSSEWLSNLPKVTQLVIEEPNSDRSIWLQSLSALSTTLLH